MDMWSAMPPGTYVFKVEFLCIKVFIAVWFHDFFYEKAFKLKRFCHFRPKISNALYVFLQIIIWRSSPFRICSRWIRSGGPSSDRSTSWTGRYRCKYWAQYANNVQYTECHCHYFTWGQYCTSTHFSSLRFEESRQCPPVHEHNCRWNTNHSIWGEKS